MAGKKELLPELSWKKWSKSANTVHLFTQIIGKIRLALMPMQAEWAQVPFTVTSRGLASTGMPVDFGSLDIAFDFISHSINFHASNASEFSFSLKDLSVAEFYKQTFTALKDLNVNVKIWPMSVEVPKPVRMDRNNDDNTYEEEKVNSWWKTLVFAAAVLEKYRSNFWGKQTQVSFFWGTFDLAVIRFSGKPLKPPAGVDIIHKVAMDAEQSVAGFWPGDDNFPTPVFFAYIYPKPEGIEKVKLSGEGAWSFEKGEFLLPYESIRHASDPANELLTFLNEAYLSGAKLSKWDTETLDWNSSLHNNK